MYEFWKKYVIDYIIGISDVGYCYYIVNFCV